MLEQLEPAKVKKNVKPLKELPTMGTLHLMQRARLTDTHSSLLENLTKENAHKQKYWLLGQVKSKRKNGKTTIRPIMKAYDEQPKVQKESYLYEVDNVVGTRKLLWVMHPNNKLSLPTIGKAISVAG
jgi:hypothetical protein